MALIRSGGMQVEADPQAAQPASRLPNVRFGERILVWLQAGDIFKSSAGVMRFALIADDSVVRVHGNACWKLA